MWLQTQWDGLINTDSVRRIYRLGDRGVWANLDPGHDVEICACDTSAQAYTLIINIRDMIARGVTVAIVDGDNTLFERKDQ